MGLNFYQGKTNFGNRYVLLLQCSSEIATIGATPE